MGDEPNTAAIYEEQCEARSEPSASILTPPGPETRRSGHPPCPKRRSLHSGSLLLALTTRLHDRCEVDHDPVGSWSQCIFGTLGPPQAPLRH